MGLITVLDPLVANRIAAGEVVDRPASVVKEVLENSLDADATEILVEIEDGGRVLLRVKDNGCGLAADDAVTAFERHATSKVASFEDLDRIITYGFRGEALASIASVARIELLTRRPQDEAGTRVIIEGGRLLKVEPVGCPPGFDLRVRDLFYNTPVRRKFLKSTATELTHISGVVLRAAMSRPDLRLTLLSNGREIISAPVFANPLERMGALFGVDIARQLVPIDLGSTQLTVHGFVGRPAVARKSRDYLHFFVNERPIRDNALAHAVTSAYGQLLKDKSFPVAIIFLEMEPDEVDVNIHPQKQEVRFANPQGVYSFVRKAVSSAIHDLTTSQLQPPRSGSSSGERDRFLQSTVDSQSVLSGQYAAGESMLSGLESGLHPEPEPAPEPLAPPPARQAARREAPLPWEQPPGEPSAPPVPRSPRPASPDLPWEQPSPQAADSLPAPPPGPRQASGPSPSQLRLPSLAPTDLENFAGLKTGQRWQVIGQFAETFILVQDGRDLLCIDQHVVQERLHFEKHLAFIEQKGRLDSQALVFPESVRLSPAEWTAYLEHREQFQRLGLELQEESMGIVLVRSVPLLAAKIPAAELVRDLLDQLREEQQTTIERLLADLISTVACKASVKGYTALTHDEMQDLIGQLFRCRVPTHCPHGRPIILRLSEGALRRAFERGG